MRIAAGLYAGGRSTLARGLVGLASLAAAGTATAGDPAIGAVFGAGAGAVHYSPGYVYGPPPVYYPRRRGPVYVVPPPVVYVPSYGPGYWRHGVDAWGRPFRTWIPAPRPYGYQAPPPHRHHPGYRHGNRHRW